ncbi:MAG TPA: nitrate reductase cytochrome c-type subunit [Anaerolineae bacterium]|nr:nitrate reductase cytochrome c-type subunit [Anaerolineae bacterium]
MNNNNTHRSRLGMIIITIILMGALVYLVGTSLQKEQQTADIANLTRYDTPSQPITNDPFLNYGQQINQLTSAPISGTARTLDAYYSRRAYAGAPPIIPHPITDAYSFGGNTCLQCHQNGDYTPEFQAYAPIVPHPELINCRQCHVPVTTDELFTLIDWQPLPHPEINQSALPGSPPPIPHGRQMRDNCIACHASPATADEIRLTHPERSSCLQCHVYIETNQEWIR